MCTFVLNSAFLTQSCAILDCRRTDRAVCFLSGAFCFNDAPFIFEQRTVRAALQIIVMALSRSVRTGFHADSQQDIIEHSASPQFDDTRSVDVCISVSRKSYPIARTPINNAYARACYGHARTLCRAQNHWVAEDSPEWPGSVADRIADEDEADADTLMAIVGETTGPDDLKSPAAATSLSNDTPPPTKARASSKAQRCLGMMPSALQQLWRTEPDDDEPQDDDLQLTRLPFALSLQSDEVDALIAETRRRRARRRSLLQVR
eukprot:463719-Prorocentrum_minimum.AAC.3